MFSIDVSLHRNLKNEVNRALVAKKYSSGVLFLNLNDTTMRKLLIMTTIFMGFAMVSCNVTRVITNESQYVQKGDTSVVIQTKTIETYEASKK